MPLLLFILFVVAEVNLSSRLAHLLGTAGTWAWLLGAFALGVWLLKRQGPADLMRRAQQMQPGANPGDALLASLFSMLAAVLLIVPGVLSDLLALVCLIPSLRHLLLRRWLSRLASSGRFQVFGAANFQRSHFEAESFKADGFDAGNVYEHQGPARVDESAPSEPVATLEQPASDSQSPRKDQ